MTADVQARVWYTYHFETGLDCASGCGPGAHPLYEGTSFQPWVRVLQHAETQPWWGHQTGYQVHPGVYATREDAEAAEYLRIRRNLPLANVRHNEANEHRWDFGDRPARRVGRAPASRGRAPARRRGWWRGVRRRWWLRPAGLAGLWLSLTCLFRWVAAGHLPGWAGWKASGVGVMVLMVVAWRQARRGRRRRRARW